MNIVVHDASVLIDLCQSGLLEIWLREGCVAHTTRYVVDELTEDSDRQLLDAYITSEQLTVTEYDSSSDTARLLQLSAQVSSSLSIQDCSALLLATEIESILLTGDAALRRHAEERHIEVHGMLWVLDTLVNDGHIAPSVAAQRLKMLMESSWYPEEACLSLLEKWDE
jgi:predicted nucleic acid-binding protein